MKFRTKLNLIVITGSLLLAPLAASADGGIFIPPQPDIYLQETRQRAAIFYENGTETLILSTTFKGNAEDFGWVIPTPARPEVSKASLEVFQNLEQITGQRYSPNYGREALSLGAGYQEAAPRVVVIETKKIDYYHIDILEANDANALADWLTEHNYHFPSKERYVLNDYLQNNWYFIAVKIDTTALGSERVNLEMEEGSATPLKIVFPAKNIVYPLKISSIKPDPAEVARQEIEEEATVTIQEPTSQIYGSGIKGMAVILPQQNYLTGTIDNIKESLSMAQGTFQLWFKPSQSFGSHIYQLYSLSPGQSKVKKDFDVTLINSNISLTIADTAWTTLKNDANQIKTDKWNHLVVTFQPAETPKLYLNNQKINLHYTGDPTTFAALNKWLTISNELETIYVGDPTNKYFAGSIQFDEIFLTSEILSPAEIAVLYEQAGEAAPNPAKTEPSILSGYIFHRFDDQLSTHISPPNSSLIYSRPLTLNSLITIRKKTNPVPTYTPPAPQPVPIELYVITTHRQTLPSFSTPYAGWIRQKTIEDLGVDINGNPLIEPPQKKYFLTKLTRDVRQEEMTEDLFLRQADNDDLVNARELPLVASPGAVVWLAVLSVLVSVILLSVLIWWTLESKKKDQISR